MRISKFHKYWIVWWRLAGMSFLVQCSTKLGSLGWLGGKVVRLIFYLVFLLAIFQHVPKVAGYSIYEVAFFFLTFNLIDILAQLFFRGIYMIGRDVREGDMDFYLSQPLNPLFRVSCNHVDFLDFLTLLPVLFLLGVVLPKILVIGMGVELLAKIFSYLLLCANGVLLVFAIHLWIAAFTVRTQQLENTIWLYRDLMSLGRFPIEIYREPLSWILTTILPIAVMISYPAKAFLGTLSVPATLYGFLLSGMFLLLGIFFWKKSLRHYCSVSS